MHFGSVSGYDMGMLTKILTAAFGLILALILLRFFAERAHRAQLKVKAEARQRSKAAGDSKPQAMVTLEIDPDTGVYRPKG